jgi:hypothetical protein
MLVFDFWFVWLVEFEGKKEVNRFYKVFFRGSYTFPEGDLQMWNETGKRHFFAMAFLRR